MRRWHMDEDSKVGRDWSMWISGRGTFQVEERASTEPRSGTVGVLGATVKPVGLGGWVRGEELGMRSKRYWVGQKERVLGAVGEFQAEEWQDLNYAYQGHFGCHAENGWRQASAEARHPFRSRRWLWLGPGGCSGEEKWWESENNSVWRLVLQRTQCTPCAAPATGAIDSIISRVLSIPPDRVWALCCQEPSLSFSACVPASSIVPDTVWALEWMDG